MRNFKTLASLCSWASQFEFHLVGNPEGFLVTGLICVWEDTILKQPNKWDRAYAKKGSAIQRK